MTIFEEIANLDRPFVPVVMSFGSKTYELQARRPNSIEADIIDSYYSDEYAKLIVKKTESHDGKESELDQMRRILHTRSRHEITEQLLETRKQDLQKLITEKIDFNPVREISELAGKSDEEKEAYLVQRRAELKVADEEARAEITAEYNLRDFEELVELLSQVNINVKALAEAMAARNAMYLYLVLQDKDGNRIAPSAEALREQLQAATILKMVKEVEGAFALWVRSDLPFVSQADSALNGQPSSANTSEPETTQSSRGGKPTANRQKNSKRSTTPQGGTRSKKV